MASPVQTAPRVALVAVDAGSESALWAASFRELLDAGWDAHVLCEGGDVERLLLLEGFSDAALRSRVHPPPPRLRASARPGLRSGLARAAGRAPLAVARELGPRVPPVLRYLRAVCLALRPDIVHVLGTGGERWARTAALGGARLVLSPSGESLSVTGDEPAARNGAWTYADLIVVETTALAEAAKRLGIPEDAVAVVPPPVAPVPRETYGLAKRDGPLRILSVGPLSWSQGLEHSMRAVRLLADDGVPSLFRIVGSGDFLDALGFARHQLGLEGAVELLEFDRPLDQHLCWADVLVAAAVVPGSPATTYAAFAHGVPVVTTEPPAGAEDAVLAVPKRDSEALSSHLARLARDPALRERLVAVGRAWVSERRSARPPGGLSALYRSLLERGR